MKPLRRHSVLYVLIQDLYDGEAYLAAMMNNLKNNMGKSSTIVVNVKQPPANLQAVLKVLETTTKLS